MCGRYQVMTEEGVLQDVFPSEPRPVLTAAGEVEMRWGFTVPGLKRLVINARSESAAGRATFAPLLASQRCLIPDATFYEWDQQKQPHIYRLKSSNSLYMAGLYRQEADGALHYVILTRPANALIAAVHSRMPCLMESDEYCDLWLRSDSLAPSLLALDQDALEKCK